MPQTLQCYKCGAQNILGIRFCTTCGAGFFYKCPQCGTNIEPGFEYCSGCSAQLIWGTKTEKPTVTNSEQANLVKTGQEEQQEDELKKEVKSKQRGLSFWLISFIIVVILIGAIFAIDAML